MHLFSRFAAEMFEDLLEDRRPLTENSRSLLTEVEGMQRRSRANFGKCVRYFPDASWERKGSNVACKEITYLPQSSRMTMDQGQLHGRQSHHPSVFFWP